MTLLLFSGKTISLSNTQFFKIEWGGIEKWVGFGLIVASTTSLTECLLKEVLWMKHSTLRLPAERQMSGRRSHFPLIKSFQFTRSISLWGCGLWLWFSSIYVSKRIHLSRRTVPYRLFN